MSPLLHPPILPGASARARPPCSHLGPSTPFAPYNAPAATPPLCLSAPLVPAVPTSPSAAVPLAEHPCPLPGYTRVCTRHLLDHLHSSDADTTLLPGPVLLALRYHHCTTTWPRTWAPTTAPPCPACLLLPALQSPHTRSHGPCPSVALPSGCRIFAPPRPSSSSCARQRRLTTFRPFRCFQALPGPSRRWFPLHTPFLCLQLQRHLFLKGRLQVQR
jgi:hypothetical protein